MYKKFIDFLVRFYSGTISFKLGKLYMSAAKPTLLVFILIWGVLKVIQATHAHSETGSYTTSLAWWDLIMLILLIPQLLATFSMFAVKEQKRLNG